MSATEPDTSADAMDSAPQFPLVLRGYDRALVDSRVAELVGQLASERRRGDEAERALSQLDLEIEGRAQRPDSVVSVEADVVEVLQHAGEVAARLLADAGRRIEATIEAAGAKTADRLKAAVEKASNLEQRARATLAEAETERAHIQAAAIQAAEQVRARADHEARAVVAKAQQDAELAWQNAAGQRRLLEAEAEGLATLRQRMVEQLEWVYGPVGLLVVDVDFGDDRDLL